MSKNRYILSLNNLALRINLGAYPKERARKQTVHLTLKIIFNAMPRACISDQLKDAICYDELCKKIKAFCTRREFNLLEHFAFVMSEFIKNELPSKTKFELAVVKKPKIIGLESSSFIINI